MEINCGMGSDGMISGINLSSKLKFVLNFGAKLSLKLKVNLILVFKTELFKNWFLKLTFK